MSYSDKNPAFDRMLKGRHDALIQSEAMYATALQRGFPEITRTQALLLAFAKQHDWGKDAAVLDGGVQVSCQVQMQNGDWTTEIRVFRDMRSLRIWAGY